jgi:hypothetical protein
MRTAVFVDGESMPDGHAGAGDLRVHYNGDWSGTVEVRWDGYSTASIPGWVAQKLFGHACRDDESDPTPRGPLDV